MGNVGDVLRGAREAEREQIYSSVYKLRVYDDHFREEL